MRDGRTGPVIPWLAGLLLTALVTCLLVVIRSAPDPPAGQRSSPAGVAPEPPLPESVVAVYWRTDSSPRLTTASHEVTVFLLAFATSAQPGTGLLTFTPDQGSGVTRDQLRADIAAVQARGAKVLLSVGGQLDGGIALRTAQQVKEAVDSITAICDVYGCDGVDWDLEHGGAATDLASLVSASASLKAARGADFAVTASVEPGVELYERFAVATGSATVDGATYRGAVCDLYGPQFYDHPQTPEERISDIVAAARRMRDLGLPPSRFAIGTTYAGSALGDPGQMPVEEYLAAYRSLTDAGLEIRGAYVWDMTVEARSGYPFARAFGREMNP
ncbi:MULTISPECIES: glycosyl hydrolase family 18 protein [unclassified Modestobacter]